MGKNKNRKRSKGKVHYESKDKINDNRPPGSYPENDVSSYEMN